jgi:hypothetical protein
MFTIEQTVEISADHRIFLDLPRELPTDKARVELTLTPLTDTPQASGKGKIRLTKPMIDELLQGDDLRFLTGFLHTEISADDVRADRLKKHDFSRLKHYFLA